MTTPNVSNALELLKFFTTLAEPGPPGVIELEITGAGPSVLLEATLDLVAVRGQPGKFTLNVSELMTQDPDKESPEYWGKV